MKKNLIKGAAVIVSVIVALAFIGCPEDEPPPPNNKEALLLGISLNEEETISFRIGTAIPQEAWEEIESPAAFTEDQTGYVGIGVTTSPQVIELKVSPNATALFTPTFARTGTQSVMPTDEDFEHISGSEHTGYVNQRIFYVKVTSGNKKTTNYYRLEVLLLNNARPPVITTQPVQVPFTYVIGENTPLPSYTVAAELDGMQPDGTLGYQWFSATSETGGTTTAITGSTSATFTPPAPTAVGDIWYFAEAIHDNQTLSGNKVARVASNRVKISVVHSVTRIRVGTLPNNMAISTNSGTGSTETTDTAVRQPAATRGAISLLNITGSSQITSGSTIEITLTNPAAKVTEVGFRTSAGNAAATLTDFGKSNVGTISGTSTTFTVTTSAAIPSAADTFLFFQVEAGTTKRWYQLEITVVVPGPNIAYYDPGQDRIVHDQPSFAQGARGATVETGWLRINTNGTTTNGMTFTRGSANPGGFANNIVANYMFPTIEGQNISSYQTIHVYYSLSDEGALGQRGDHMIRTLQVNSDSSFEAASGSEIFLLDGTRAPFGFYNKTDPGPSYPDLKRVIPGWEWSAAGEPSTTGVGLPLPAGGAKGIFRLPVSAAAGAGFALGYNESNPPNRAETFTVTIDQIILTKN